AFLQEAVATAGPQCRIFLVSDHGFTGTSRILYINTWLEREGYLAWKPGTEVAAETSHELEPDFYQLSAFDMSTKRAFALTAASNGIHISVHGRRGQSGIAPEEYGTFRQQLVEALLTRCMDPESGEKLVLNVSTREEIFRGPSMGLAPDLTLTLRDYG